MVPDTLSTKPWAAPRPADQVKGRKSGAVFPVGSPAGPGRPGSPGLGEHNEKAAPAGSYLGGGHTSHPQRVSPDRFFFLRVERPVSASSLKRGGRDVPCDDAARAGTELKVLLPRQPGGPIQRVREVQVSEVPNSVEAEAFHLH